MKKLLILALAVIMVCAAFTGCGDNSKKDEYIVLDENFGAEQYGIGFRKGDDTLTLKVQEIIDAMIADGKAAEISKKWFGSEQVLKGVDFPRAITDTGDTSLADIQAKGKIVLGLDVGFKPMGYYAEGDSGEIIGFDVDLAKEVASRLNVELVLQPIDWAAKELELSGGNIDLIWNGMSITDERVESMNMSKPYLANKMIIIVNPGSGIKTKADLAGKKIAVQAGSSALDAINNEPDIASTFGALNEYPDNPTAFLDLKAGRVDALVVDEVVGRNLIAEN